MIDFVTGVAAKKAHVDTLELPMLCHICKETT